MTFVNEYITPEDRERYQLETFEKKFFTINPGPDWAIDRHRDIFLRVIRPEARKSEPGDPDARFEKDFQFHWKGYDYLVSTRRLDSHELQSYPGEIFQSDNPHEDGARVLRFYLRHIGEVSKPKDDAPSALAKQRKEVLNELECALAYGEGGVFARLTKEQSIEPRYAIFKIAPNAVVAA